VANAGPDQAVLFVGQTVQLDGSGSSDADGDPLTFAWAFTSRPAGSQATLSNPNIPNPTFVSDALGPYMIQLIVNDGILDSLADTVIVTADNIRPVANAGLDQPLISVPQTVQLDGSGSSDADGDPLTYRWSFTSRPPGSQATLSDPTLVNPTFVADVVGTYVVQLLVNDGTVDSPADTVMVTFTNTQPVANAGLDQAVVTGQTVQLDGSGSSDPDGDPLTYRWTFTTQPQGECQEITLSNPSIENPTFFACDVGTYVVQLIVNDGTVDSLPDTVMIVSTENIPPVANAGLDQAVVTGQTVQLDGSGSSDPDGKPLALTFSWELTVKPIYSQATLSNPILVNPTFVADQPGAYTVQLIVNDGIFISHDEVIITADGYYIGGSINSKTRFASILGTASLTVMILGLFSSRRHGSTR
jgi:hypothetical protein